MKPPATVSVDVDPVDLHLVGYGHRGLAPDPTVYRAALPRLLEAFADAGVAATFFVVGRDAEAQAAAIRALRERGHEVASHSLTHPFAFARLPSAEMRRELEESRRRLEAASEGPVIGFRSPNFDLDARALEAVAAAGYRYDASAYPTPMLLPARLLLALKSRSPDPLLRLRPWPLTWRRRPFVWPTAAGPLVEFPLSVGGGLRVPVYHTARYWTSREQFERALDARARAGEPLSYALHAVDALGQAEDRVDPRLARHPGMALPLAAKLELLAESLAAIAARFAPAPFASRLSEAG